MQLHETLGLKLPLIQAPMAGVQGSALALAVCNAGGMGSLPAALLSPEQLRKELAAMRAGTDRPYNVNFFCHRPPQPDARAEAAWRQVLAPYYAEFGIGAEEATRPGASRTPFSETAAEILEEFRPAVVSFHFGLPEASLMARVKAMGSMVLSSATTVEEARWLVDRGADAVIAQGFEAGGHRGMFLTEDLTTQLGTMALVPQIAAAAKVPVIATGGIADAAGARAALALGASMVQVGTAYLRCPEATTSGVYREALASDAVQHTAVTNLFTGRPARGIVNRVMRELGEHGAMRAGVPQFPLAAAAVAPLRARAESQGDGGFTSLWCGQNASGCLELSAAEITRRLMAEKNESQPMAD